MEEKRSVDMGGGEGKRDQKKVEGEIRALTV